MYEINEILQQLGMSYKEFSEHYEIPYNTVRQWAQGTRKPPIYVIKLLNEKIEKEAKGEQISFFNEENIKYITIREKKSPIAHIFKNYEDAEEFKKSSKSNILIKIKI